MTRPTLHTTQHRAESNTNVGAKIWYLVPQIIKDAHSLFIFI